MYCIVVHVGAALTISLGSPVPIHPGDDDLFLVIASDGIWDTMTSDLVAKFVLVNTCKIVDKSLKVGENHHRIDHCIRIHHFVLSSSHELTSHRLYAPDDTLLQWIARQVARRAK